MIADNLKEIKAFAMENFCLEDESQKIYADDPEFAVTNPWMDHSGRFELSDEQAVKEWGLKAVLEFCEKAQIAMNERDSESNGNQNIIQKILDKYQKEGYSARPAEETGNVKKYILLCKCASNNAVFYSVAIGAHEMCCVKQKPSGLMYVMESEQGAEVCNTNGEEVRRLRQGEEKEIIRWLSDLINN